jgi:uncharacterized protein YndB with AHSA1/START domain
LITIAMSATIAADPRRVWRALTSPEECVTWDDRCLGFVRTDVCYPEIGELTRWRYKLGNVPVVMQERPVEVAPPRKLQSNIHLGSLRFEQTYTLALEHNPSDAADAPKTRLGMRIVASNAVPVLGAVVDRFEVRRLTIDRVDSNLRAVTKWCENNP